MPELPLHTAMGIDAVMAYLVRLRSREIVVALVACDVPAPRGARIDPVRTLAAE